MKQFVLFFLILPLWLSAQISFTPASLNFGDVNNPEKDSVLLTIQNDYDTVVSGAISIRDFYSEQVFSVDVATVVIQSSSSESVWVYFEPEHNIEHLAQLVFESSYRGDYLVELRGNGKFSNYYSSTFNLEGEPLKTELGNIISNGFSPGTYNSARDEMYMVIDNQKVNGQGASVNTLEGVYTGDLATNYSDRQAAQGQSFNTEHTFPQGQFSSAEPMKSDLFHLFPTKQFANSSRGNFPFGDVVSNSSPVGSGGSFTGNDAQGTQVFEPRDEQKGRAARAMFYFVLKYQNYNGYLDANQESDLRQWHYDFFSDQEEKKRNNDIFAFQNNRNPFIDYPQFADRMNFIGNAVVPTDIYDLYSSQEIDVQSSTADTTITAVIENRGNTPIQILTASIINSSVFFLRNNPTGATLAPGEGVEIKVGFTPQSQVTITDTLRITTDIPSANLAVQDVLLSGSWMNLSTDDIEINDRLLVFPNPTTDMIYLKNARIGGIVSIFDVSGTQVLQILVKDPLQMIDINDLPAGMYLIHHQADGKPGDWTSVIIQ